MGGPRRTLAELNHIRELSERGYSTADIARKLDRSTTFISRCLTEYVPALPPKTETQGETLKEALTPKGEGKTDRQAQAEALTSLIEGNLISRDIKLRIMESLL